MSNTVETKANGHTAARATGCAPRRREVVVEPPKTEGPKRAFWQASPCPAWCDLDHEADLCFQERNHFESFDDIDLTLYTDLRSARVEIAAGKPSSPALSGNMFVSMNQHYREIEPTISINVPTHTARDEREVDGEVDVEMTIDEARELIARLTQAVEASENGAAR